AEERMCRCRSPPPGTCHAAIRYRWMVLRKGRGVLSDEAPVKAAIRRSQLRRGHLTRSSARFAAGDRHMQTDPLLLRGLSRHLAAFRPVSSLPCNSRLIHGRYRLHTLALMDRQLRSTREVRGT